ncbi:GIN domain-containing protein [Mucilaginibacter sp.]|uniref:GIN domain-containing protein n=1 Tax=Mucilaginibacter sp. TaxID=1882438 RepID=UPI003D0B48AC
MKTTILTIAILFASLFGFRQSSFAATNNDQEVSTVLTDVNKITDIEVHGNVELYISDGSEDQVKVYNKYYGESALVQDQNGVLRISSYTAQKLKVWVTVSDLRNLEVYDNAEVKSFGKLSAIELDVKLYNTASAKLSMDAYTASISLNDRAKADLTGSITDAQFKYDHSSFLNTTTLLTARQTKAVNPLATDNDDIAELASL